MARSVSRRAQRVWDRLLSWYGARLAEQFGKHPPDDWAVLFDRTDDERLEQALLAVRRSSPGHPPTLGEIEAALPAKPMGNKSDLNPAEALCAFVVRNRETCQHQRMRPWSYFGPVVDFPTNKARDYPVSHPSIRGVVVPSCGDCGKPSLRVMLDELVSTGAAA